MVFWLINFVKLLMTQYFQLEIAPIIQTYSIKKNIRLESVHNAIEQGKTIASYIVGEKIAYNQVPWFWSDQYETKLQIVGLIDGYDEIVVRGDKNKSSFAVFYLKNNKIIASDCVNRPPQNT